jgi:hypothetical protein
MISDPMAARDGQARAIPEEFLGWEAWQSLDGHWHRRYPAGDGACRLGR